MPTLGVRVCAANTRLVSSSALGHMQCWPRAELVWRSSISEPGETTCARLECTSTVRGDGHAISFCGIMTRYSACFLVQIYTPFRSIAVPLPCALEAIFLNRCACPPRTMDDEEPCKFAPCPLPVPYSGFHGIPQMPCPQSPQVNYDVLASSCALASAMDLS